MEGVGSTSAFKSRVVKILVGPTEEAFHAHESILCKSEVLRMALHGGGREQWEGKLTWPDWTVSGAEKFLEWLYTGDYKCPYPIEAPKSKDQSDNEDGEAPSRPEHGNESHSREYESIDFVVPETSDVVVWPEELDLRPLSPVTKNTPAIDAATALKDLSWSGSRLLGKMSQAEEFESWTGHQLWRPDQLDYEATFQTHAELYKMGHFYLLEELKNMAWQRLRSVLISIGTPVAGSRVIANLVMLIHYAYEVSSDTGNEEEPLRKLITTFVALYSTRLRAELKELIMSPKEPDREFVWDLMAKMAVEEGTKSMQTEDQESL
ncbi:MAG: hypothetical protein Q9223_006656, partial [Gallowayella weberi]